MRYIEYNKEIKQKIRIEDINIYTDSSFVYGMLSVDGYPKLNYYYQLLMIIFDLCNKLKNDQIHINIVKVSSHKGEYGNQMADKVAREAANIARMCKYGESRFVRYDLRKIRSMLILQKI